LITHCALGGVQEPTNDHPEGMLMAESVYKVIELVGTSTESWEKAAAAAIRRASKTLRDLRVAEVSELDLQLKDGDVETYRAKVKVSFKYEDES
jgi:dodecin